MIVDAWSFGYCKQVVFVTTQPFDVFFSKIKVYQITEGTYCYKFNTLDNT